MLDNDLSLVQWCIFDLLKELHLLIILLQIQVLIESLSNYLVVVHEGSWELFEHIVLKLFQSAPLYSDQCIDHPVKLPEKNVLGANEF